MSAKVQNTNFNQIQTEIQVILQNTIKKIQATQEMIEGLIACRREIEISIDEVTQSKKIKFPKKVHSSCLDNFTIEGTKNDSDKFMVEIGTGYFIEKNTEKTVEYFKRRIFIFDKH